MFKPVIYKPKTSRKLDSELRDIMIAKGIQLNESAFQKACIDKNSLWLTGFAGDILTALKIREKTNKNDGERVEEIQSVANGKKGYAWCMYQQEVQVAFAEVLTGNVSSFPNTGSCASARERSPKSIQIKIDDLQYGDIMIKKYSNGTGHTGNFRNWVDRKRNICNVNEGNTTQGKAGEEVVREGGGSYLTERDLDDGWIMFCRPFPALGAVVAPDAPKDSVVQDLKYDWQTEILQVRLVGLGFDPGPIDGIPGVKTKAAVGEFQKKYLPGSKGSGVIGPKTVEAMNKLLFVAGVAPKIFNPAEMLSDWPKKEWNRFVLDALEMHGNELLNFDNPKDANEFNFKAKTREEKKAFYLMLISSMARYESNFKPHTAFEESGHLEGVTSRGLLQISLDSGKSYNPSLRRAEELHDVKTNIETAVMILNRWIPLDGYIGSTFKSEEKPHKGGARYWSVLREHSGSRPKIISKMKMRI